MEMDCGVSKPFETVLTVSSSTFFPNHSLLQFKNSFRLLNERRSRAALKTLLDLPLFQKPFKTVFEISPAPNSSFLPLEKLLNSIRRKYSLTYIPNNQNKKKL